MSWFRALSEAALARCKDTSNRPRSGTEDSSELAEYVPESFTLRELADAAREPLGRAYSAKPKETFTMEATLMSILTCLHCGTRIRKTPRDEEDEDAARELARSVAVAVAPAVRRDLEAEDAYEASNGASNGADDPASTSRQLSNYAQAVGHIGVAILDALTQHAGPVRLRPRLRLHDEVLLTLLAFTDGNQSWASPQPVSTAARLLEQQFGAPGAAARDEFVAEAVLQRYLRPLFSRSRPASVTASGRRAAYAEDGAAARAESMPDESAVTKPWKYADLRAIPVVSWAVRVADTQLVAKSWPLFIPVLLTLVDDPTTSVRRQGLVILTDFLAKFPAKTLQDTGLAKVFEDAVFPTLAFLPSLTPADESAQLLSPAYDALLRLAEKQQQPAVGEESIRNGPGPMNGLLDKVLREGVFTGYFHAREHVAVVEVLCRQTAAILARMGVHGVKHLKDLIPMLSSVMTDPFAPVAPATLLSAIGALQAVLANCWPRIPSSPWQDEIINALVLCWLHLVDHANPAGADPAHRAVERELLVSVRALAAVLKTAEGGPIDLATRVAPLVEKDPRLRDLFSPVEQLR